MFSLIAAAPGLLTPGATLPLAVAAQAGPIGKTLHPALAPARQARSLPRPERPRPVLERPFSPLSAQGAATILETYVALIQSRLYPEAYRLWADQGRASGMDVGRFTARWRRAGSLRAQVGAPGPVRGSGGTLYVTVPATLERGVGSRVRVTQVRVTLKRSNRTRGVDGPDRRWRLWRADCVGAGRSGEPMCERR
jgi:hypothetical protein